MGESDIQAPHVFKKITHKYRIKISLTPALTGLTETCAQTTEDPSAYVAGNWDIQPLYATQIQIGSQRRDMQHALRQTSNPEETASKTIHLTNKIHVMTINIPGISRAQIRKDKGLHTISIQSQLYHSPRTL